MTEILTEIHVTLIELAQKLLRQHFPETLLPLDRLPKAFTINYYINTFIYPLRL